MIETTFSFVYNILMLMFCNISISE